MKLKVQSEHLSHYLEKTSIIDFDHPEIIALAENLKHSAASEIDLVKRAYEYVRDEIAHSADIHGNVVTCKASEVLSAREGICFAKSHLLAALLRYNRIPTGFCYQLLRIDEDKSHLILHGLNAVYIESIQSWIRLDARGNKPGVNAQFSLYEELIAFPADAQLGEIDYPEIYASPDPNIVYALTCYGTFNQLWLNLPHSLSNRKDTHS